MRRPDEIEIEALRTLVDHSEAWRLVRMRLEETKTRAIADLVAADSWDKTIRLQERIQTIETALAVPGILLREMRDRARRGD
jgi:hypothetical protein